jgi:hypothetical protein
MARGRQRARYAVVAVLNATTLSCGLRMRSISAGLSHACPAGLGSGGGGPAHLWAIDRERSPGTTYRL